MSFGKNLQKIRRKQNITQEELAYESGISLSQIVRIETGRIKSNPLHTSTNCKTLKIKSFRIA
ncbi:MAG: helix-turn-helix transcriptional regulator [Chloroflexia bacterium]|nr:helix-turn-helix transcriptional regulator [Chloroflexia bacterium]